MERRRGKDCAEEPTWLFPHRPASCRPPRKRMGSGRRDPGARARHRPSGPVRHYRGRPFSY
ncbi:MAG: hypothetical protein GDA65_02645 [Nitrospira sp. CR1.1]|nr:hypothetical protein [Nitrospira sp. CR1.1]